MGLNIFKPAQNIDLQALCPFVSILSEFDRKTPRKRPQTTKKCRKIGRFCVYFSPRRWQVGKNPTKLIFCRFRILKQIYGSIYGSREKERSLDPTFVLCQNLHFMDEYLALVRFLQILRNDPPLRSVSSKSRKLQKNPSFSPHFRTRFYLGKSGFITLCPFTIFLNPSLNFGKSRTLQLEVIINPRTNA